MCWPHTPPGESRREPIGGSLAQSDRLPRCFRYAQGQRSESLELFQLVAGYPCANSSPSMRFTCLTQSAISTLRSRRRRRRSSSSGVGALTIAHARGSPRLYVRSARTSASPSIILSVSARQCRGDAAIEAGSTTWLSIPSACSTQWIQNPSRPASRIKWEDLPSHRPRFLPKLRKRSRSPATLPPRIACFDIFAPLRGDSDVISQVGRLSSNETKIAPRLPWIAFGSSWYA
jgi:hypothetical protein